MSYGYWGRSVERETRAYDEKAYRRQNLPIWDARWHELSAQARSSFLNEVKGPVKKQKVYSSPPSVSIDKFPPPILKELTDAGFVAVQPGKTKPFTDRVIAPDALYDFASRLRTVRRLPLLTADRPNEFAKYVDHAFVGSSLIGVLYGILRKVGIKDTFRLEEGIERYVMHYRWPGWVAQTLKDPLADRIIEVLQEAKGPIPLADLPGRIEGSDPGEVRTVVDKLVSHLALVEDLRPETWELMVGFLPAVREELIRASQPRERPPLVVCERPKELGPDGSTIVNDLRAFLLEVASEPPRLRQDQTLFQKEFERFQAALEPLPAWFLETLKSSDEARVNQALAWARTLQLVKDEPEEKQIRLQVASKGQKWLSGGLDEQYAKIYDPLRRLSKRDDDYLPHLRSLFTGFDPFNHYGHDDTRFLGAQALVRKVETGKHVPYYWEAKPEDHQALRKQLDQALDVLKPGVFYRLDSIASHLAFGEHNPLNLGLAPNKVTVFWMNRLLPPLEEQREETGRLLIDAFVRRRLIPLGASGRPSTTQHRSASRANPFSTPISAARLPWRNWPQASEVAARVVVQPDFSVVIIGLNPAPAAELAPFCERTTRGGTPGALVLKITRDSVVKAVSHGLKPAEIVARLKRHASNEVPANVLREVQDWSNWVRQVTTSTLTVLRCPDRDTADRVMGALKRQAERINETLVAIDQKKLTTIERNKLRGHGIIVQTASETRAETSKKRSQW